MPETAQPSLNHYVAVQNGKFSTREIDGQDLYFGDNLQRIFTEELTKAENKNKPLVLYFHGGLVNERRGMEAAAKLEPKFLDAGGYPLFFVWQSGLLEVGFRNIPELIREKLTGENGINKTKLFKILTKKLKRYAASKLKDVIENGGRSGSIEMISPIASEVETEIDTVEIEIAGMDVAAEEMELSDAQMRQLEDYFMADDELKNELEGMVMQNIEEDSEGNARGASFEAPESWISASVMEEIKAESEAEEAGAKGPFAFRKIIKYVIQIGIAVFKRYANKTHHGLRLTITEEILRKLYIDDIGGFIWEQMKKDTADAFKSDASTYAGTALLKAIQQDFETNGPRKIIMAGHSTGAVYICNLLKQTTVNNLDASVKFDIAFLAAACTFDLFAETIDSFANRIDTFRSFGMKDEVELDDKMVPVVFPASLLYFVSGLLEKNADGELIIDAPLVGMERYYENRRPYANVDAIQKVKAYVENKTVWSIDSGTPGWESESESHGGFDDDDATINSVKKMIADLSA